MQQNQFVGQVLFKPARYQIQTKLGEKGLSLHKPVLKIGIQECL